MSHQLITVAFFVVIYSVIQSIFGVGLLVFGTPTLLLLGYSFHQALFYLLPCSIAISLFQTIEGWQEITLKRNFVLFCLPAVAICLSILLLFGHSITIKKYVGILMIITALTRIYQPLRNLIGRYYHGHIKPAMVIIGILHGFTNMGGGLLSLFISSLYTEKKRVRSNIGFGYLLMALCQIVVLCLLGKNLLGWETTVLVLLSLTAYLVVGNKIFIASSEIVYQRILTLFISIFGITLLFT